MKKLIYAFTVLAFGLVIIHSCKIDPATNAIVPAATGQLGATKLTIESGKLDTISVIGAPSGATVTWSVAAADYGGYITPVGSSAIIQFFKSGNYTVSAVVNGGAPITIGITVTARTGVIPSPGSVMHYGLTGEQIMLTPSLHTSANPDSVYIQFNGITGNTYPCGTSNLTCSKTLSSANAFTINITDVTQPAVCGASASPALTRTPVVFLQNSSTPYLSGTGTYPLTITAAGTTYTGSISITPTTITFNWTYVSGVTLVNKVITR